MSRALNFFSGLAQGFVEQTKANRDRLEREELKKLQVKMFKHDLAKKEEIDNALSEVMNFLAPKPSIERTSFTDQGPQVEPSQKRGLTDLLADPEMAMKLLQSGKMKDVMALQELQGQRGQQEWMRSFLSGGAQPGGQPGGQPGMQPGQPGGLELTGLKVSPRGEMMPDFARPKFKTEVPSADGMSMIQLDEFGREMGRRPLSPAERKKGEIVSEVEKKQKAQRNLTDVVSDAADIYRELNELGSIVNVKNSTLENIMASISASGTGQFVGTRIGTKAQSLRNKISQIRPTLINWIRQASEMGVRGLDSEKELQFYLQAATDPQKDIQSNLAALKILDDAYGIGTGIGDMDVEATKSLKDEFKKTQSGKPSLKGLSKQDDPLGIR